ncbi:EamA family transporter, partial [Pseudomonas syringae pv. actinidiae]|nr:EamA family transporter [Pseudomonas syringae pv. actinidiae]
GMVFFFSIPQVALASYLFEDHQWERLTEATWHGWSGVVYSAVGSSLLAYSLWYGLLKRLPVNKVMPYSLLCPVGAIALGCLVMHETLTPDKVIGAAVVIMGVA